MKPQLTVRRAGEKMMHKFKHGNKPQQFKIINCPQCHGRGTIKVRKPRTKHVWLHGRRISVRTTGRFAVIMHMGRRHAVYQFYDGKQYLGTPEFAYYPRRSYCLQWAGDSKRVVELVAKTRKP